MGFTDIAMQTVRVLVWFCLTVASMLAVIIIIRRLFRVPQDIFRKMLHAIAFGMSAPIIFKSDSWQASAACLMVIMLLAFIVLTAISRLSWYSDFFVEKEKDEIRTSMIFLLIMQMIVTVLLWGWRNSPAYAVTAIYMWGMGDAFAAIIGRRLGKHRILWKIADNNKTFEGTAACFFASFAVGAVMMSLFCDRSMPECLGISFAAALVCAFVEMLCRRGTDTFFVPLAVTGVLIIIG